jgi:protein kinase A
MLAQHKVTKQFYAMKILKKRKVVEEKQVDHTINERDILLSISSPFIVSMDYYFKDNSRLYMLLEFVPGGEMYSQLKKSGQFCESQSRFYASQLLLALEYLHNLNIVYRDLKPENILFDVNGYIKLTDFGFAKRIKGRAWTHCGTSQYLAPELILSKGYNKSVDYWALGVVLYEMVAGSAPFYDKELILLYEKIISGVFHYPPHFTAELNDLLRSLIQVDLTKRLGNLKGGIHDIKSHVWFSSVDFMAIYQKEVSKY